MTQLLVNNCYGRLADDISAEATTMTVYETFNFPSALPEGYWMLLTLYEAVGLHGANHEIVRVTQITYNGGGTYTLSIERGLEGTTANAWVMRTPVEARATAGLLQGIQDELSALQPWAYAATAEAARTGLELGSAAIRNAIGTAPLYGRDSVVGTVSESDGVPTGALVQYGSNSNGEFWRYAGGMQVCTHIQSTPPVVTSHGGIFISSSNTTWTFPAPFISTPGMAGREIHGVGLCWLILGGASSTGGISGSYRSARGTSQAEFRPNFSLIAVGEWAE